MSEFKYTFNNLPSLEKFRILCQKCLTEEDEKKVMSLYESKTKKQINPWIENLSPINDLDFIQFGKLEEITYYEYYKDSPMFKYIVDELKQFKFTSWRRIIGNGNCFFVAVLINYIELLCVLSIKEKQIDDFICFVSDIYFTDFENICIEEKKLLMSMLLKLSSYLASLSQIKDSNGNDIKNYIVFDLFYRSFLLSEDIQNALIRWFKLKIKQYIQLNCEENLNGISLIQSLNDYDIDQDNSNSKYRNEFLKNYFENELLKDNVFAEGIVLYVSSLVLKLPIVIYHVDMAKIKRELNNQNLNMKNLVSEQIFDFDYKKRVDINVLFDIKNCMLPIDLDKENKINLLFLDPHYDLIYTDFLASNVYEYLGLLSDNYSIGKICNNLLNSNIYESTPNPDSTYSRYIPSTLSYKNSNSMDIKKYKSYVSEVGEIIRKYTLNLKNKLLNKEKEIVFNKKKEEWLKLKAQEDLKKNQKNEPESNNISSNNSDFFLLQKSMNKFNINENQLKNSYLENNANYANKNNDLKNESLNHNSKLENDHISFVNPYEGNNNDKYEKNERSSLRDRANSEVEKNKGRLSSSVVKLNSNENDKLRNSVLGNENQINNSLIISKKSKEYDINSYDKNEINKIIGVHKIENTICCYCFGESDNLKFKCGHEYCFKCFEKICKEIYRLYERIDVRCDLFNIKNSTLINKIFSYAKNIKINCISKESVVCSPLNIDLMINYYNQYLEKNSKSNANSTPNVGDSKINGNSKTDNKNKELNDVHSSSIINNDNYSNLKSSYILNDKSNDIRKSDIFNSKINSNSIIYDSNNNFKSNLSDSIKIENLSNSRLTTEEIAKVKFSELLNNISKSTEIENKFVKDVACKQCKNNKFIKLDCCMRQKCVKCLCEMFNVQIEKLSTGKSTFLSQFKYNNNNLFELTNCQSCFKKINNKFLEILKVDKIKELKCLRKLMDKMTK